MQIGSMFVRLGLDMSDLSKGIADAQAALEGVGRQFSTIGTTLSVAFTAPLAAVTTFSVKAQASFEQAMNKVAALIDNVTKEQMGQLDALALKLGKETQFSAKQAADAMGEMAAAGFSASEVIGGLKGVLDLAAVGQLQLGEAAAISSGILKGFGIEADKMGYVTDVLAKVASKSAVSVQDLGYTFKYVGPIAKGVGLEFQEVASAAGLLGNAFIKGEQAGTSLRGIIARLADPSREVRDIFKSLGIEVFDSQGKMKSLADIMDLLTAKGLQTKDVLRIFGQEAGVGMVALMNQGSAALRRWTDEMEKVQGTSKQMADIMRKGLAGQWEEFTGTVETLGISIGRVLQPVVEPLIKGLTEIGNKAIDLAGSFGQLPQAVQLAVGGFVGLVAIVGPATLALGKMIEMFTGLKGIPGVIDLVSVSFTKLSTVPAMISNIAYAYQNNLVGALTAGEQALLSGVAKWTAIGAAIYLVVDTVKGAPAAFNSVQTAASSLATAFESIISSSSTSADEMLTPWQLMEKQLQATKGTMEHVSVALTSQQKEWLALGASIKSVWDIDAMSLGDRLMAAFSPVDQVRILFDNLTRSIEYATGKYKVMDEVAQKTLQNFNTKYVLPSMKAPADEAVRAFEQIQNKANSLFNTLAQQGVVVEKGNKSWREYLSVLEAAQSRIEKTKGANLEAALQAQRYADSVKKMAADLRDQGIVVEKGSMSWNEYKRALEAAEKEHKNVERSLKDVAKVLKDTPRDLGEFQDAFKKGFDLEKEIKEVNTEISNLEAQLKTLDNPRDYAAIKGAIVQLELVKKRLEEYRGEAERLKELSLEEEFRKLENSMNSFADKVAQRDLKNLFKMEGIPQVAEGIRGIFTATEDGIAVAVDHGLLELERIKDAMPGLKAAAKELGIWFGDAFEQMNGMTHLQALADQANDAFLKIKQSSVSTTTQVNEAWLAYLSKVADAHDEATGRIKKNYDEVIWKITMSMGTAGQKLTLGLEQSLKDFKANVGASFEGFFENLLSGKGIKGALNSLVSDLQNALVSSLDPFKKAFMATMTDLFTGKGMAFPDLVNSAKQAAKAAQESITGATTATQAAQQAAQGVKVGMNTANQAANVSRDAGTAATTAGTAAQQAAKSTNTAASAVSSTVQSVSTVTNMVTGAVSAITGVLSYLQGRRMEQDIGRIEVTTREIFSQTLAFQERFDQYLPYLMNTKELLRLEMLEGLLSTIRDAAVDMLFKLDQLSSSFASDMATQLESLVVAIQDGLATLADNLTVTLPESGTVPIELVLPEGASFPDIQFPMQQASDFLTFLDQMKTALPTTEIGDFAVALQTLVEALSAEQIVAIVDALNQFGSTVGLFIEAINGASSNIGHSANNITDSTLEASRQMDYLHGRIIEGVIEPSKQANTELGNFGRAQQQATSASRESAAAQYQVVQAQQASTKAAGEQATAFKDFTIEIKIANNGLTNVANGVTENFRGVGRAFDESSRGVGTAIERASSGFTTISVSLRGVESTANETAANVVSAANTYTSAANSVVSDNNRIRDSFVQLSSGAVVSADALRPLSEQIAAAVKAYTDQIDAAEAGMYKVIHATDITDDNLAELVAELNNTQSSVKFTAAAVKVLSDSAQYAESKLKDVSNGLSSIGATAKTQSDIVLQAAQKDYERLQGVLNGRLHLQQTTGEISEQEIANAQADLAATKRFVDMRTQYLEMLKQADSQATPELRAAAKAQAELWWQSVNGVTTAITNSSQQLSGATTAAAAVVQAAGQNVFNATGVSTSAIYNSGSVISNSVQSLGNAVASSAMQVASAMGQAGAVVFDSMNAVAAGAAAAASFAAEGIANGSAALSTVSPFYVPPNPVTNPAKGTFPTGIDPSYSVTTPNISIPQTQTGTMPNPFAENQPVTEFPWWLVNQEHPGWQNATVDNPAPAMNTVPSSTVDPATYEDTQRRFDQIAADQLKMMEVISAQQQSQMENVRRESDAAKLQEALASRGVTSLSDISTESITGSLPVSPSEYSTAIPDGRSITLNVTVNNADAEAVANVIIDRLRAEGIY